MEKDSEKTIPTPEKVGIPTFNKVETSGHTTAQTYAEDMARAIADSQGGAIKKIIHGEEEKEALKKNLSPQSKKNRFFMLMSLLLMFVALATISYFFFKHTDNTVPVEKQFTPIIFNDKSVFLDVKDLDKDKITQTILNEVNTTEVKAGGVEGIYLTENKKVVGLRKFTTLIKSAFVSGDNTLFVNDNFLLGVVNGEAKDFFMLLKMRSITDIFDAMRAWEGKMFSDLHGFFGVDISSETKALLTADFQNGIVENKNARILYDQNNKIIMMYILADDNSVIITNTEKAAHEIMLRLAGSQIKK